jgi:hypothetical protein
MIYSAVCDIFSRSSLGRPSMEVRKLEIFGDVGELESCIVQDEGWALGYSIIHR